MLEFEYHYTNRVMTYTLSGKWANSPSSGLCAMYVLYENVASICRFSPFCYMWVFDYTNRVMNFIWCVRPFLSFIYTRLIVLYGCRILDVEMEVIVLGYRKGE